MKVWQKQIIFVLMLLIITGIIMNNAFTATVDNKAPILIAYLSPSMELQSAGTSARGRVVFFLSDDGQELHFKFSVSNATNVKAAHIYLAPGSMHGRVVVTLFNLNDIPPRGAFNGAVSEGVIRAKDLVGPLVGNPLNALLKEMSEGSTYILVLSEDYPMGLIRGKIVDPSTF